MKKRLGMLLSAQAPRLVHSAIHWFQCVHRLCAPRPERPSLAPTPALGVFPHRVSGRPHWSVTSKQCAMVPTGHILGAFTSALALSLQVTEIQVELELRDEIVPRAQNIRSRLDRQAIETEEV